MNTIVSPNRRVLVAVARRLAPILEDLVFVGGQVGELLISSPGSTRIRPTMDVDVVVEASTRGSYRETELKLSALGLSNDVREGAPICRWLTPDGHGVDVMPALGDVLGFTNRWYPAALAEARPVELEEGLVIRVPPAPVFLGTKWEAFHGRGGGDILGSHDLEDLITVVAGRPEIVAEVRAARADLREYLALRTNAFLEDDLARYAIQGALPDAIVIPELVPQTLERMRDLGNYP